MTMILNTDVIHLDAVTAFMAPFEWYVFGDLVVDKNVSWSF